MVVEHIKIKERGEPDGDNREPYNQLQFSPRVLLPF